MSFFKLSQHVTFHGNGFSFHVWTVLAARKTVDYTGETAVEEEGHGVVVLARHVDHAMESCFIDISSPFGNQVPQIDYIRTYSKRYSSTGDVV